MPTKNFQIPCLILGVKQKFRGSNLIKQLHSFGFEPQIIYGLDAGDPKVARLLKSCVNQTMAKLINGRTLNLGEVACALGHIEIYREFLRLDKEWAIVFEDDVSVLSDLEELKHALKHLIGPSIIQIYKSSATNPALSLWTLKQQNAEFCSFNSNWDLIRKLESTNGTYAYLINRSAALLAVKHSEGKKIIGTADWPILWRNRVSFWETTIDFVSTLGDSLIDRQQSGDELKSNLQKQPTKGSAIRFAKFINELNPIKLFTYIWHGYPVGGLVFGKMVIPLRRKFIKLARARK